MAAGGGGTTLTLNLTAAGGSQVTATLNQVSGAAERAGGSFDHLGRVGQAATFALGQAIYGVTSKLVSMAASVVESGVATAATIESQTVALKGLTGSATEANTLMAQLMETAKKTPFDTDNVIAWGEKLLGAGMNADHVNQSINTLGDTFSHFGLSNDQASHAMVAWTQMMNAGVVHSQDLNQLVQAGIPIYGLMAKAMHTTAGAFKAQVDTGTVLSKDVLPAVEAFANKNFMGSMADQAGTLSGMWENLKDTINLGVASAIKPAEPAIKHALGDAMTYAGNAATWLVSTGVPMLMQFGSAVKEWVGNAWQEAQPFLQTAMTFITDTLIPDLGTVWAFITGSLIPTLETLYATLGQGFFDTIWAAVQWGIDNLPTLGGWLNDIGGFISDHADAFQALGAMLGGALIAYEAIKVATWLWVTAQAALDVVLDANPIGLVVIAVGALVGGFLYLWNTSRGFRQFFETMWNNIVGFVGDAIKGILGYLQGLLQTIANVTEHMPGFGWLHDMAAGAASDIDAINAKISSIQRNVSVTVEVSTVQVTDSHGNSIAENVDSANQREDRSASSSTFSKGLGLKGKNNEAKIWNYLRRQGFSAGAAAGVIGNLIAESGLEPGIFQRGGGPGRGLAQWSAGARWDQLERWTRARHMNSSTLDGQLAFMMHELGSGGYGNLAALKHMSANDAAAYFMNHYEMPASRDPSGRQGYARAVLARHGGGTVGTPRGNGNGYQRLSGAPPFNPSAIKDDLGPRSSFMKSVLAGRQQLQDQFYRLIDDVNKAGNAHANALVRAYGKSLLSLAKVHDAVVKRLKDAQDQVKKIRDASQQLYDQTRQNIIKTGDVTTGEGKDFGSITSRMLNAVNAAKTFAALVGKLRSAGLNTETLEQIIASGPEQGTAYGQSILNQGRGGIGKVNDLEKQLEKAGGSVAATASNQMYKAALASAAGFAKGLESQRGKLEKLMTSLASTMARALRKALGIKSPSRVFMEIGHFTADGLIQGMNARQSAVSGAASDLLSVGMGSRRLRSAPGARAVVPPVVVHVHGYVGSETQLARQITQTLTRASGRGVNGAA